VSNVRAGIGVGVLLGLALSALLILMAMMATAPAQAETTGDCKVESFNKLQGDITTVPITDGKVGKEHAGLVKLVDDAQYLASIGKTSDAVKKLSDFTVKVDQLEAAGRISAESANMLRSDAKAIISSCLQG
jgi:FIMAH domain